jgi:hypothetical protein
MKIKRAHTIEVDKRASLRRDYVSLSLSKLKSVSSTIRPQRENATKRIDASFNKDRSLAPLESTAHRYLIR